MGTTTCHLALASSKVSLQRLRSGHWHQLKVQHAEISEWRLRDGKRNGASTHLPHPPTFPLRIGMLCAIQESQQPQKGMGTKKRQWNLFKEKIPSRNTPLTHRIHFLPQVPFQRCDYHKTLIYRPGYTKISTAQAKMMAWTHSLK